MTATTRVREMLTAALADIGVPVLSPPTAGTPPCVVLVPGSPWREPVAQGSDRVAVDVTLVTGSAPGQLRVLEDLEEAVRAALTAASGVLLQATDQPRIDSDMGHMSAVIPTATVWKD